MAIAQKLEGAMNELDSAKAKITELESSLSASSEKFNSLQAQFDAYKKDAEAAFLKLSGEASSERGAKELEISAHKKTREELAKAQQALANPAFADAGTRGAKEAGINDAGFLENNSVLCKNDIVKLYEKISDPRERAEFRIKYKKEMGLE